MSIGVIATLTIQDGKNAEFEAEFTKLAEAVNTNEEGNIFYALFQSSDNPQQYKVMEQYANLEARKAHGTSEHFIAAGPKLAPFMAAPPAIEELRGV